MKHEKFYFKVFYLKFNIILQKSDKKILGQKIPVIIIRILFKYLFRLTL